MVTQEQLAYRRSAAAKQLGISADTLDRLIQRGELRAFRVGAAVFVSVDELRNFIKKREAESD